jgi:plasmid stabilization system protein ParE
MSKLTIIFSPRAKERLEEIAEYLYQQNLSTEFVVNYLNRLESWLNTVLCQFPESGTPMPQFGERTRRVAYNHYSVIYRVNDKTIEILTLYRGNLP